VAWSGDGGRLASGSDDNTVRVWDARRGGELLRLKGHGAWVRSVAWSGDGGRLASGSDDNTVRVWDANDGKCEAIWGGHIGAVYAVAFTPDGRYLAAGAAGRLAFWDCERKEAVLYSYQFAPGVWLNLLPDGRFDAHPDAFRYLRYTEEGTLRSYAAEDAQDEFYDPQAVSAVLAKISGKA
jgi:WD40 repeat protein